jgi:hypothetical protein
MTTMFSSPSKQGQQAASASEGISADEMAQLQNYINTTNTALRGTIGGNTGGNGHGVSNSGTGGGFIDYAPGGQSIKSTGAAPAAPPQSFAPQGPPAQSGIAPAPVANPNIRRTA